MPQVYLDVARKLSSPLLMGPPICDELVAFVRHLFTEEEAGVVRHLGTFAGMTAAADRQGGAPAARTDRADPPSTGRGQAGDRCQRAGRRQEKYRLMPIMPGIFEMVLIGESPESMSDWHRRFAELFEALYETGYAVDYQQGRKRPSPFVRVLSVGRAIEAHPMALPSDHLEVVLDRYRRLRRRPVPVPDDDAGGRPGLRQAAGQLHGDGPVGRAGNPAGLAANRSPGRTCWRSSARPSRTAWSRGS